ncbi:MAG TPA: LytTR family DNA-binding domain-containing protein, partial [Chitinophagaceae bacterium]
MRIRTILIDDEPLALTELKDMLCNYNEIDVIETAENAVQGTEKIRGLHPDLIFLDINIPGKTGVELLEGLDEVPHVIFVTAFDQYAINAFDVNALDYILKPVNAERLQEAIEKIKKQFALKKSGQDRLSIDKRIFIKDGEKCFFLSLSEVLFFESVGNYARIYQEDKKMLLHRSLNYLEDRLPETHFFRTGRQYIINTLFIKNIHPYF